MDMCAIKVYYIIININVPCAINSCDFQTKPLDGRKSGAFPLKMPLCFALVTGLICFGKPRQTQKLQTALYSQSLLFPSRQRRSDSWALEPFASPLYTVGNIEKNANSEDLLCL
jgi:hypothetical protein